MLYYLVCLKIMIWRYTVDTNSYCYTQVAYYDVINNLSTDIVTKQLTNTCSFPVCFAGYTSSVLKL